MVFALIGWFFWIIIPYLLQWSVLTFNIIHKVLDSSGTLSDVVTFFNWIEMPVWFARIEIPSASLILKFSDRLVFLIPVFRGTVLQEVWVGNHFDFAFWRVKLYHFSNFIFIYARPTQVPVVWIWVAFLSFFCYKNTEPDPSCLLLDKISNSGRSRPIMVFYFELSKFWRTDLGC